MALRQGIRLTVLYLIVLTFPITLNYFSVYLIIEAAGRGIMNASFFFWSLFAFTSLALGRAGCGYVCPLGALQEVKDRLAPKRLARIRFLKVTKYVLAVAWVGAIVAAAVSAGGYREIDLLYNTEALVSIDRPQGWITYGFVAAAVLLPAFFIGKRGFCHYFCPWGVLNTLGTKAKDSLRWPSLRLRATPQGCKQCKSCDRVCPMSLPVSAMVQSGSMANSECILCGSCVDNCLNHVISYSWRAIDTGQTQP